jgi:hypothetical protein
MIAQAFANGPERFIESDRINGILNEQYDSKKKVIESDKRNDEADTQKLRYKKAMREKMLNEQREKLSEDFINQHNLIRDKLIDMSKNVRK